MQVRPTSPAALVDRLADRIDGWGAGPATAPWVRVAIDGAPAARPDALADALADPLRVRGRPVLRVSAGDFLRPASLRLEHGRTDPDSFYQDWLDLGALEREVLTPLAPGGSGRVLPARWNSETDRASRSEYRTLPPGGVLLLDGALLLGRGLDFDLTVHLWLSPAALARRSPPEAGWTLPAYARYAAEAEPARTADVVVRADDPARPAVVEVR